MQKLILFFLFISTSVINIQYTIAQEVQPADSVPPHTVMLIPYDPIYYLSDAERDIEEQTKRDLKKVRESFRKELDRDIYFELTKYFACEDMLYDTSSVVQEDLTTLMNTTGYSYATPMPVIKHELSKADKRKNENSVNPITATSYLNLQGGIKYMNVDVTKPKLLEALHAKYNTDLFLFINQFEIKTNYNSCLDIANKIYQRQLMIHFSLYDYTGKQLAGNFAYSLFPSSSSKADEIMKKCYPEITKGITEAVKAALIKK